MACASLAGQAWVPGSWISLQLLISSKRSETPSTEESVLCPRSVELRLLGQGCTSTTWCYSCDYYRWWAAVVCADTITRWETEALTGCWCACPGEKCWLASWLSFTMVKLLTCRMQIPSSQLQRGEKMGGSHTFQFWVSGAVSTLLRERRMRTKGMWSPASTPLTGPRWAYLNHPRHKCGCY